MIRFLTATLFFTLAVTLPNSQAKAPYMANGVKIGEVDSTSAVIWTRLTTVPDMITTGEDPTDPSKKDWTPETAPEHGSVPGMEGKVRLRYWPDGDDSSAKETEWTPVDPKKGHVHQFQLTSLRPGTIYHVIAEPKDGTAIKAKFRTAPAADQAEEITFMVVTGQDYPRRDAGDQGHKIYPHMLSLNPNFFVHTGDIEYFDKAGPWAQNLEVARYKFTRLYALPNQRDFHNHVPSYFITWQQGLDLFVEQFPMKDKTYRTIRWGKNLQVWFVEGRDFRSANTDKDGKDKTIWGAEQKKWFFETFAASDATYRILVSPTPVVGPDRKNKRDNHANKVFAHEGDEIRTFIASQKNAYIICGDRHWQYHSIDPKTKVHEFSCGPTSDEHASGFSEKDRSNMHQFLRVKGGFLAATVDAGKQPKLTVRHYDVDGNVVNEAVRELE